MYVSRLSADSPSYRQINEYMKRFPDIPDILELDRLTVAGDVRFGRNISLKVLALLTALANLKIL